MKRSSTAGHSGSTLSTAINLDGDDIGGTVVDPDLQTPAYAGMCCAPGEGF